VQAAVAAVLSALARVTVAVPAPSVNVTNELK
jgi:hypothetical protein